MLTNIRTQWFRVMWLLAGASCLTYGSACSDDKSGEQKGTAVAEAGSSSGKAGQSARAGAGGKNSAKAGAGGAGGTSADADDDDDKATARAGAGGASSNASTEKSAAGSGGLDMAASQGGKAASAGAGAGKGGTGGNASSAGKGGSSDMSMTMAMAMHKEDAQCVACEMKPSSTDPQAVENCTKARADNCMKMPGRAMGGSLVGEKRSTLCLDLLACMHATKCAYGTVPDSASATDCFCGTGADRAECKEKPLADLKGACKAEFAAAAETDDPKMVIDSALDTSIAVGAAVALLETCDDFFCPVCHGGASTTTGSSGLSGGQAGMPAAGTSAAGQGGSAGPH
jgi:hypothetical protein